MFFVYNNLRGFFLFCVYFCVYWEYIVGSGRSRSAAACAWVETMEPLKRYHSSSVTRSCTESGRYHRRCSLSLKTSSNACQLSPPNAKLHQRHPVSVPAGTFNWRSKDAGTWRIQTSPGFIRCDVTQLEPAVHRARNTNEIALLASVAVINAVFRPT